MTASTNPTAELTAALLAVQAELPSIAKKHEVKRNNGQRMYSYADLADTLAAIREPLAHNGLALAQTFETEEGAPLLVTTLYHTGGGTLSSRCPVGVYKDPQDTGKAITYFRRYSIMALLCLATEDSDAQGVSQPTPMAEGQKKELAFLRTTQPLLDQLRQLDPDSASDLLKPHNGSLVNVQPNLQRITYNGIVAALKRAQEAQDKAIDGNGHTTANGDPVGQVFKESAARAQEVN